MGATIGGDLDCTRGTFDNPKDYSLSLQRIDVKGEIFLSHGFISNGEVGLAGAKIGGDLNCIEGTFTKPTEGIHALSADGIEVKGDVFYARRVSRHRRSPDDRRDDRRRPGLRGRDF